HRFADELELAVTDQRAREKAGLTQDLETVADPRDGPATAGELHDGLHHRSPPGDGAGAQIVAVGEPAREDHRVDTLKVPVPVPQRDRLAPHRPNGAKGVAIVQRAGERDDADAGHSADISRMVKSSITGFDSRRRAMSSTWARAVASF